MNKFLIKGILGDRSRSLLPIIVVTLGVFLTVFLHAWITGILGESIVMSANINTGHVKVMSRAYAKESAQLPNDLVLLGVDNYVKELNSDYPEMDWVKRIRFGALADVPDANGETRAQGPVFGWAMDLLSADSKEPERFNLKTSLVQGRLPENPWEAIIADGFALKFDIKPGDKITLFGTTMEGGMAFKNFTVSGTLRFGTQSLDKGAVLIDITDAQTTFGMEDGAGEILGFFPNSKYNDDKAEETKANFNSKYESDTDEYAPVMLTLRDQEGMGQMLSYTGAIGSFMVILFVLAMSIVLWNSGILGALRRYSEFGIRLALGENKWHIFKTLIFEGLIIGIIGSIIGTALGLGVSYLVYIVGFDMSGMMKASSLMIPTVVRTDITPTAFYIGFIPGVFSVILGNALAARGIFKRNTARLFNELEV